MYAQDLMLAYDEDFTAVAGGAGPRATDGPVKDFTEQLRDFTERYPLLATPPTATVLAFGAGPRGLSSYVVPTQRRDDSPAGECQTRPTDLIKPSPSYFKKDKGAVERPDEESMGVIGQSVYYQDEGDHDDHSESGGDHGDCGGDHGDCGGDHGDCGGDHLDEADSGSPYMSFHVGGEHDSILSLAVDK